MKVPKYYNKIEKKEWTFTLINVLKEWINSLDSLNKIKRFLWGDLSIEPFYHQIDKNIWEYNRGLDGLLGLKIKAKRFETGRNFIRKAYHKKYYFNYLRYLVDKIATKNLSEIFKKAFRDITNLINTKLISKEELDLLNERFDLILNRMILILLFKLKKIKQNEFEVNKLYEFNKNFLKVDLHLHSYYSDCGIQTIPRLIYEFFLRGFQYISLTDHNTFNGVIDALKIGKIFNINVIPGIEISVGVKKNNNSYEEIRDILVYFPDVVKFTEWAKKDFDPFTNELLKNASKRKYENDILISTNVSVDDILKWAKMHKGITFLAHPGYWNKETPEKIYSLFKKGLNGIEIYNRKFYEKRHYPEGHINIIRNCVQMVNKFEKSFQDRKLISVGSDSHAIHDLDSSLPPKKIYKIISYELNLLLNENESIDEFIKRIIIKPLLCY